MEKTISLAQLIKAPWSKVETILATLVISILSLALPIALLQVYDRIIPAQSYSTLIFLLLGVVTAVILELSLRQLRSAILSRLSAKFEYRVNNLAFHRLLHADFNVFQRSGPSEHLERFQAIQQLKDYYSGQVAMTLFEMPFTLVFLALIFYLGGWLVIIPAVITLLLLLSAWLIGIALRAAISAQHSHEENGGNFLVSVLLSLPTVKALAMEEKLRRKFEHFHLQQVLANQRVENWNALLRDISAFFTQLSMILIAAWGSVIVISGNLTVGGLAACTLLAGRALQPLQGAIGVWTRLQSVSLAKQRVENLLSIPETQLSQQARSADTPVVDIQGDIELRNLGFRPENASDCLFSGINLNIKAGEIIAITGTNAGGKTTLLTLIRGLSQPSEGEVLIDGKPLHEWPAQTIKQQIAWLPQRESVFQGTILDNITFFRPHLETAALELADLLGFAEEIRGLPLGFRTPIGDGSSSLLPRGLIQRLSLARAMINQPRILLFDEANSAVDELGDAGIKRAVETLKGRCTIIMVTHRPSIMLLANRVHGLYDGHLEEEGIVPTALTGLEAFDHD